MDVITISLLVVAVVLLIVGIALAFVVLKKRREGKAEEVNYRVFIL